MGFDDPEKVRSVALTPWVPGGETYHRVYEFSAFHRSRAVIVKDCIGFAGLAEQTVTEWHERRQVVSRSGLQTPQLWARNSTVIMEEYIHDTMPRLGTLAEDDPIFAALNEAITVLLSVGFRPISLHDWRWRDSRPVVIDFGSDLGPDGSRSEIDMPSQVTRLMQTLL